ncbi:dienelactone hydrolase family protein [Chiayiivirga flava]|uniref:Dienelactone hydrolase n=1 Tax=Chiayiivirga flava TaxID=659595 RepID=A0A7W8DAJ2_9GAMM|nr:dienelactone hydrolase family protein [Chiayiivirga flava]MBB5209762.1 dienelactone hydrolase [Chiayiivirga flava]
MRTILSLCLAAATPLALAAPQATPVEWELDGTTFSGMLVYDHASREPRPGVLMMPNWMGVTDDAVAMAKRVAGDDYVVLIADVYGKGVRPADATEAKAQVTDAYQNVDRTMARAAKALAVLATNAHKAPLIADRIGAIGFCFGGSVALELSRHGADLDGVVTLHGGLRAARPADTTFKPSVLVLNGAADKSVSAEEIAGFRAEMDAAKADWQFVDFSGALHCFSEPEADGVKIPGCKYDERSAQRAMRMASDFFEEKLGG